MSEIHTNGDFNFFIEKAYSLLLENDTIRKTELHSIIDKTKYSEEIFGWKLLEMITTRTKNCRTTMYPRSIQMIGQLFNLFPKNNQQFKKTSKRMFANMILELGQTGFLISSRHELDIVLNDFSNIGFISSRLEVIQVILDKLNIRNKMISQSIFKKLSIFVDLEEDLKVLLKINKEKTIIIGLIAEKYITNPLLRLKEKGDWVLMNEMITEGKNLISTNLQILERKAKIFFDALMIALSYDDKSIQYCISNYFYTVAQIYYQKNEKYLALFCYEFSTHFFKKMGIEILREFSKTNYYETLSEIYSKEKRFNNQEIALAKHVKHLKKIDNLVSSKSKRRYYNGVLKLFQVKIKNSFYRSEHPECIKVCNVFLIQYKNLVLKYLTGKYFEDIISSIYAYRAESMGKIAIKNGSLTSAIEKYNLALSYHNKREEPYNLRESYRINRMILYASARQKSFIAQNDKAYSIMKELLDLFRDEKYIDREYYIFNEFYTLKFLFKKVISLKL